MNQHVEYYSEGRSGVIMYNDDFGCIKMHYEFGGGNCVAIIFLPDENEWANLLQVKNKNEVLTFIAKQVIHDQAPHCHYMISDKFIEIFRD